jgi:hypothetical protein
VLKRPKAQAWPQAQTTVDLIQDKPDHGASPLVAPTLQRNQSLASHVEQAFPCMQRLRQRLRRHGFDGNGKVH